jgi:hypothetical protein
VLSFALLVFGFQKARHFAALSFGGLIFCNAVVACLRSAPGFVTPYQNVLGDIATLSVGIALAASYILAAQLSTPADRAGG